MKIGATSQKRKLEINLVPLLDSIFILIFFFMFALSTMVKRNGLAVALPASGEGKKLVEKTTLTINKEGQFFWNKNALLESNLVEKLKAFKATQPEAVLVIRGDRNTPFEYIVRVLDTAEKVQLRRVTIETESK